MTISQFETAWDRGILGVLKSACRLAGETLIRAGVAIESRTKTPAHKHLDYIFSPEARRRAVDVASSVPAPLLGDIDYEQGVVRPLNGVEEESIAGEKSGG